VYRKGGGHHGGTGYPMIRLLALVACGTRTIIDATFATSSVGETTYTHDLLRSMHSGMIVLADRNFAARSLIAAITDTGADLLIRVKNGRKLPVCRRLRNGSSVSRIGPVEVQVINSRDHHRHHRRPTNRDLLAGHHHPRSRLLRRRDRPALS
jgi:hypothetical protein